MAGLLAPPGHQYQDNNGTPLALGKVYTYVAGSLTNKATYSDSTEATPLANPVVLDANGRTDIWLATDGLYKIVIYDANNNLISTTDDVSATGGSFLAGITAAGNLDMNNYDIVSNNNANIDIIPHGTGKTNIYDPVCKDNLDLDGNNIIVTDSTGIVETSTLNELLLFNAPASSVNYLQIDSSVTSSNPILSAKGDDTNVGIDVQPKGTGAFNVRGTADTAAAIRLYEDTDNGTNYIGLKAPSTLSGNLTFTLPSTPDSANQQIKTNGSGTLGYYTPTKYTYLGEFSGGGNVDVTSVISSTYDHYYITFTGDGTTGVGGYVYMYVSTDNGSTWESTNYYSATSGSNGRYLQQTNSSSAVLSYNGGFDRPYVSPGEMLLYFPSSSSKKTFWTMLGCDIGGTDVTKNAGGFWNSTTAVNALRFSFGYGTPNIEYVHIWGIDNP